MLAWASAAHPCNLNRLLLNQGTPQDDDQADDFDLNAQLGIAQAKLWTFPFPKAIICLMIKQMT
jgi:hypothetical protein